MRLKRRKHIGHKPKHNKKSCKERTRLRLEKLKLLQEIAETLKQNPL